MAVRAFLLQVPIITGRQRASAIIVPTLIRRFPLSLLRRPSGAVVHRPSVFLSSIGPDPSPAFTGAKKRC